MKCLQIRTSVHMVETSGEKMCASTTRTEIGRMEEKRRWREKFRNALFLERG